VEHSTFTPLVFSATGGMAHEATIFYKRLSSLLSEKWKEPYALVLGWVRGHLQTNFGTLNVIVTLSSDPPPSLASHYKSNLLKTKAYNMLVLLETIASYLLQAVFTSFYPFLYSTIACSCIKII